MIQVENKRPANSILLEHIRQEAEMREQHLTAISKKQRLTLEQLVIVSSIRLFQFMCHVLALLFSGFMNSLFHQRRKERRHLPEETQPQKHAIELLQGNEELKLATQLEDQFIEVASHELKTPMTAISGHTQLLLRRLSRMQELSSEMAVIRTSLERIDGQTRRLNAIVSELIELSSIRAGKIDLQAGKCDLVDICRQTVEQQSGLTNRSISLIALPESIMVEADCTRMHQVVMNLVVNALNYSSPESLVEIRVSQNEGVARVEVRDSGPGIPDEQQEHLFEPFYRGSPLQESPKSGLGLGLTICKEIVDRHGGCIWCDSQEDVGSNFVVELPLVQR
jgi:signal transduction histidine kinase